MNAPTSKTVLDQLAEIAVGVIDNIPAPLRVLAPDEWEAAGLPRNFLSLTPAQRFDAVRGAVDEPEDQAGPAATDFDSELERAEDEERVAEAKAAASNAPRFLVDGAEVSREEYAAEYEKRHSEPFAEDPNVDAVEYELVDTQPIANPTAEAESVSTESASTESERDDAVG